VSAVNDLSEARSDTAKAKIALDAADKAAQRARRLNVQEALATKELQAAESELERASEEYRRSLAAAALVRNRLTLFGKSDAEIARLEESVTDKVDRQIIVRAPLGGTIVERKVGPGQYIKPDSPDPLFLISDLSTVWVTADIYEEHLAQIHIGAPVGITVTAYPNRIFPASIAAINPTVDPVTRTIRVQCAVPNPGGLLKPEMFANIRIGASTGTKAIIVPSAAVLTIGENSVVMVEQSPGHFRRQNIKTGREIHDFTVVNDGLHASDRVVTSGVLLLNNESN
jgi:cobalt-zinc-cadmium efflux system membrane fusion protein